MNVCLELLHQKGGGIWRNGFLSVLELALIDRHPDYMHGGAIGSSYELTSLLLRWSVEIPSIHLFVHRSYTLLGL